MKHTILIGRYAQEQILALNKKVIPLVKQAISGLADNPLPHGYKKPRGEDIYCMLTGAYRIIYEIENQTVSIMVVSPGHKKDIYE